MLVIPMKHVYRYVPKYIYFYHQINFYCCLLDLFRAYIVPVEYFHV